jgi:hypothetical protein
VDIANLIQTVAIYALPVLFAITIHEAAHGYVARHFGDNTAYMMGRITLNPIKHIDPIGTIAMPLLLYFATSGAFLFGYAKPVPVNFGHLRNPKRDMIWVALAGPASNFVQAIGWAILFTVLVAWAVAGTLLPGHGQGRRAGQPGDVGLQPVSAAAAGWRAHPGGPAALEAGPGLSRIEPWGFFIVMGLVIAGIVGTYWLRPLMGLGYDAIGLLLTPLTALLN